MAFVTPYGGVWIEIKCMCMQMLKHPVTPYGGVWIEMP